MSQKIAEAFLNPFFFMGQKSLLGKKLHFCKIFWAEFASYRDKSILLNYEKYL